ncbi:hypothetical protein B0T26DRAFT_726089 [Lasiosphaeria miniovina]|uniref:Actin-like ATPase domain-containing protein n=1 Tax=Lasiosphaeria miniovina TaxID=1954250 RepID=A0AA40DJV2_9PEZI|nr:uncharacterized protein B0T26DRAFT_726089 [Lasiosphaeria miniovina]KAK0706279.1 hypothetical protein B0T26DRAFT_726089 [Lasiosphaeria miniovina]
MSESESGPKEARVVLGLDYGTTHTGLAFMHQTMERVPLFSDLVVFDSWGEGGSNGGKIRSAMSYSRTPHGRRQWGNDIDEKNSLVLQWTKLELQARPPLDELKSLLQSLNGLHLLEGLRGNDMAAVEHAIPEHITRGPVEVVEEFLSRVARQYYMWMLDQNEFIFKDGNVPMDMVITHPVEWSYEALNNTYRAVTGAFNKHMFSTRRNVYFVPEPEACAVYTVQQMISEAQGRSLVPGECFVVCDAGGGTVDLVTYLIKKVEPLELEKIGVITGGLCGAIFIDQAFIRWIEARTTGITARSDEIGTGGHYVLDPKGSTVFNRFEIMKRKFTGTEANTLTLPRGVAVNPSAANSVPGLLQISADDMKSFFEFSVIKTIDLIGRQIASAANKRHRVMHIFMSGGMSQNNYVLNRVREWARTLNGEMSVQRPENGWTAVVQGAVLAGMGIGSRNAVLTRPCKRHFGIMGAEALSAAKHRDAAIRIVADEVHGANMALDQVAWLVRKHDVVFPDRPVTATARVACTFLPAHVNNGSVARVVFCATAMDDPPSHSLPRDAGEVAAVDVRLDKIPSSAFRGLVAPDGRGGYVEARLTVEISVYYNASYLVRVLCQGQELGVYPKRHEAAQPTSPLRSPVDYARPQGGGRGTPWVRGAGYG